MCLERSLATHGAAMMLVVVLRQWFCESISDLIPGVDRKDLDKALPNMLAKMMVAHVNVLGPRVKLRKPCHLKGTRIVFEDLTVHVGLGT